MFKNLKTRLLAIVLSLVTIVAVIPGIATTAYATENYGAGCWAYAYTTTMVYDNVERTVFNGKYVYASEGVTVLTVHSSSSGNVYKIQYSTTSGPKTGYVLWNQVCVDGNNTLVGIVNSNATVYSDSGSMGSAIGSVSSGEIVSILAKRNSRYYIEYNVNSSQGRKRGFVSVSSISPQNAVKEANLKYDWRNDNDTHYWVNSCPSNYPVYQIPNPNPMFFTWIYTGNSYYVLSDDCAVNGLHFRLIGFYDMNTNSSTYGQWVTGYIIP